MKLLTEQTEKNYENHFNSSVEEAWIKEAEKRCNDLKTGKARLVPGEEVFEKIKNRFENGRFLKE